jgi:hypothetical protein
VVDGVGRFMAKFFLSHSAGEGSAASELLDALVEGIEKADHKPFRAPQDVRTGDKWRGHLYQELATCDAAMVLMDRAALTSRWVHREVNILLWRKHWNSMRVHVKLLDGVTPADVNANGFGELREDQFEDAEHPAEMIKNFGSLAVECESPMRTWIGNVAAHLGNARVGEGIRKFGEYVGLEADEVSGLAAPGCYEFLAQQLLGRPDPEDTFLAVDSMRHEIGTDRTSLLAELATPALVDGESARILLSEESEGSVYLLNASYSDTASLYVKRAACCATTYRIECVSARTGENGAAELQQRCEAALARLLYIRNRSGRDLMKEIARFRPNRMVKAVYLGIDLADSSPEPAAEVIRNLRASLPWLKVIVLSPSAEDLFTALDVDGLVLLKPLLDDEEDRMDRVLYAFESMAGPRRAP